MSTTDERDTLRERIARRRLPSCVVWELFDPLDGVMLVRISHLVSGVRDITRVRRMIQRAPFTYRSANIPRPER